MHGTYLLLDGLDGIGKGVYLDAMKEAAEEVGLAIFDLHNYWKRHGKHPSFIDFREADLILSSEPTYVGHGKRIRERLISADEEHSALEIAEAYADDRKALYEAVIIPALEAGIHVIQSRGVTTSLVYQPLDALRKKEELTREDVKAIPGNVFCLQEDVLPKAIIIPTVSDVKEVIRRLAAREKQDNATFETYEFQLAVKKEFESDWFREFFENRGVKVIYADAETSIDFSRSEAKRLFTTLIPF